MTTSELAEQIDSAFSYVGGELRDSILSHISGFVEEKVKELVSPESIAKIFSETNALHKFVLDQVKRFGETEVGNRLRCGCWDGRTVDRLFDSIWTEQFDKAIQDRIRDKVRSGIDAAIADRLKTMMA